MCVRACVCVRVCVCNSIDTTLSLIHTAIRFSNILSSKTIVSKICTQTHTYTQHPLTLTDKHPVVSHVHTHARYDNIQLYSTLGRGTEESVSSLRLTAAGRVLKTEKLYKVPPPPPPTPSTALRHPSRKVPESGARSVGPPLSARTHTYAPSPPPPTTHTQ